MRVSAESVKAVGIGVALLVGAYVAYEIFKAAKDAADAAKKALTDPNAFRVTSDQNLANKAFNAVTGTADGGTLGTNIYDLIHTNTGALKWPWQN